MGALDVIEVAPKIILSEHFGGACLAIVEAVRGHLRPLRFAKSGFLDHSAERVFMKYFREISRNEKALEYSASDITGHTAKHA